MLETVMTAQETRINRWTGKELEWVQNTDLILTALPFGKYYSLRRRFPGDTVVKNLPANEGDMRDTESIPRSGRSPRERNGNPLQYSCLENPMDRGAWLATVNGLQRVGHNGARARTHTHTYTRTHTHTHTHTHNEVQRAKSGLEMKEPSLLGFL